jgi:hypothetical protein
VVRPESREHPTSVGAGGDAEIGDVVCNHRAVKSSEKAVEQRFLGGGRLKGGFGGGGGRYVEKAPAAVFEASLGPWVLDTGAIGPG